MPNKNTPPKVHEKLQPLQDVLVDHGEMVKDKQKLDDKFELTKHELEKKLAEKEKVLKEAEKKLAAAKKEFADEAQDDYISAKEDVTEAKEEYKEAETGYKEDQAELARNIADKMKDAMDKVKENIISYKEALGDTPDADKILEKEILEIVEKLSEIFGLEEDAIMNRIGLRSIEGFEDLDVDNKNEYLTPEEIITENVDEEIETVDVETEIDNANNKSVDLNKDVLSVFHEYASDMKDVTTSEKLTTFLKDKWKEVQSLVITQYSQKPAETTSSGFSGKKEGGLLDKIMPSGTKQDPEVTKFFNAIKEVGGDVDLDNWVENGQLNVPRMNTDIQIQIENISKKIKTEDIETYKKAVINEELANEKGLTIKGHEKVAELLEEIPKSFHDSGFADEYEAYVENLAKGKPPKVGKTFDEWLDERPKKEGFQGVMDKISIMLKKSPFGGIIQSMMSSIPMIKEWFGGLFGKEKDPDAQALDDEFDAQTEYKNRAAFDHMQKAETLEVISEIDWKGIKIRDIEINNGKPDLSNLTPDELAFVKKVSEAEKGSLLWHAKSKNLSLSSLEWLTEIENDDDLSFLLSPKGDSFKVTVGEAEPQTYQLTEEKVEAAQEEISTGNVDRQIGKKYAERFTGFTEGLPSTAFVDGAEKQNFENLQPALKSLLKLGRDDDDLWQGYVITERDLRNFLSAMGESGAMWGTGTFRNIETAFEREGENFTAGRGLFRSNPEYTSIKEFFESL